MKYIPLDPEGCYDCYLHEIDLFNGCRITKMSNFKDGIPDWCPLKDLPRAFTDEELQKAGNELSEGYMDGWNDCINELLWRCNEK